MSQDKSKTPKKKNLGSSLLFGAAAFVLIGCASSGNKNLQLIRAAEKGETKKVQELIASGADINARDKQGWTPYLAASSNGHIEAMKILQSAGASTKAPELQAYEQYRLPGTSYTSWQ